VKADKVTMAKVVSACTRLGDWSMADCLVTYIEDYCLEVDIYLGNTLIVVHYYDRQDYCIEVDIYLGITLIHYYDMHGQSAERIFHNIKDRNVVTLNVMIIAYAKGGGMVSERKLFEEIPNKDLISWSSMISGYSQASQFSDALELFTGRCREPR
jgi:pentatricopeptide repeat protein